MQLVINLLSHTCRQMATFTRQPKLVDTARGESPKLENSLEKLVDK